MAKFVSVWCALYLVCLAFCARAEIRGDTGFEYWPDANYDLTVPEISDVVGHAFGDQMSWASDIEKYFIKLADFAPDRVRLHYYGESWEGRRLFYLVISSPQNIEQLELFKDQTLSLSRPTEINRDVADAVIDRLPVTVCLAYGVHGNEISSPEAAMLTAYHLLASRGDSRVADILSNTLVVINPLQNPDGRDRFVHRFEMSLGLSSDPDRASAEHDEPWPSGRTNHYLFDLNRDWFAATQPEIFSFRQALLEFPPAVLVDFHEMGSDSTYFFAPETAPFNPYLTASQRESLTWFGKTNAFWFDKFGIEYFTREVFDAFYPGYGASWPAYKGAIAMTYEQASPRGLLVEQYDNDILHYREAIRNHFVASLATLQTSSERRTQLLDNFYGYHVSARQEGLKGDVKSFVLPRRGNKDAVDRLVKMLIDQGVEVREALTEFRACKKRYEVGDYFINLDQASMRLVRTLMDRDISLPSDFMREQERRRKKGMPVQIYDVTSWSLPLMMNLEVQDCGSLVAATSKPLAPADFETREVETLKEADLAYLVPWGHRSSSEFLAKGLMSGLVIKSTSLPFVHNGRDYPAGTLIIEAVSQEPGFFDAISTLHEELGTEVIPVDSGWVTDGPNFGSGNVITLKAPKVAIAWDEPANAYIAGATRFILEQEYGYPVSIIRSDRIRSSVLERYDVLILAGQQGKGYSQIFGERGIQELRGWVKSGGVILSLEKATEFLAEPDVALISNKPELAYQDVTDSSKKGMTKKDGDEQNGNAPGIVLDEESYKSALLSSSDKVHSPVGVLVRAKVDREHWIGAGLPETVHVIANSNTIISPLNMEQGQNPVLFEGPERLVASGYMWRETGQQMAYKPFVLVEPYGEGAAVAFTQDPNFRAQMDGLNLLLINAVFKAPSISRSGRL